MLFAERNAPPVVLTLFLALLFVAIAASVVLAIDVYLLVFLAVLFGVLFANLAVLMGKLTGLVYGANLGTVVTLFMVSLIGGVCFFGWRIEQQIQATSDELDKSYSQVEQWLEKHPTATAILAKVPFLEDLPRLEGADQGKSATKSTNAGSSPDRAGEHRANLASHDRAGAQQDSAPTPGPFTSQQEVRDISPGGWSSVGTMSSVSGRVFGVLGRLFSTTFGATMNVAFVFFVSIFLAVKPNFYRDQLAILFPTSKRERVKEILDMMGDTLFEWLKGRFAAMVITGTGTGIVLWLLGVPLAFTLGVITGLLTFIPSIGSILALLLAILVALSQGATTVLWVVLLYAVLQFVESNIITPLIQQRQTSVPPPLLLSAQLFMGVLTGFLGVLVATPMAAAAIVLVREAYVEDVLERDGDGTS